MSENRLNMGVLQGGGGGGWASAKFSRTRGCPHQSLLIGQWMPYNFVADGFHTKKLCNRLSSSVVRFYTENGRFAFWVPFGGLGATYDVHLMLTGKLVVDFLLVIIEPFSLVVMAEAQRTNIDWKLTFSLQRGDFDPKFQVEGVAPLPPYQLCFKN